MEIQRNTLLTGFSKDLAVSQHGYVTTGKTWVQPPLPAPYSRLYFVTGGSGVLYSEQEKVVLEPGYVYLAPCGLPCGFYGTDSVTKLYFHVNLILPDGYDLFLKATGFARLAYDTEMTEQLRKLYLSQDPAEHIRLKARLWEIVGKFADAIVPNTTRREVFSARIGQAVDYIHKHLSADLTVKQVAEALFCSETTLGTAFRKEMGATVGQYIEDMVFFEAQQMLLTTQNSIGQISSTLGFSDQFYFSRRFRKRYGISPKEYRKLHIHP